MTVVRSFGQALIGSIALVVVLEAFQWTQIAIAKRKLRLDRL